MSQRRERENSPNPLTRYIWHFNYVRGRLDMVETNLTKPYNEGEFGNGIRDVLGRSALGIQVMTELEPRVREGGRSGKSFEKEL